MSGSLHEHCCNHAIVDVEYVMCKEARYIYCFRMLDKDICSGAFVRVRVWLCVCVLLVYLLFHFFVCLCVCVILYLTDE